MPDIDLRDPSIHEVMRSWQGYCTRGSTHAEGYNSGLQVPTGHLYVVDHVNIFNMNTGGISLIMAIVSREGGTSSSNNNYAYGGSEDHFLQADYDTGNRWGFQYNYLHYYTTITGRTKFTASDRNTPIYLESGNWLTFWNNYDDDELLIHISYRDFF